MLILAVSLLEQRGVPDSRHHIELKWTFIIAITKLPQKGHNW